MRLVGIVVRRGQAGEVKTPLPIGNKWIYDYWLR